MLAAPRAFAQLYRTCYRSVTPPTMPTFLSKAANLIGSEVSPGNEATATHLTTLKPTDSLEDLSAQLMGDSKKGIKNVSWSPPQKA